MSNLVFGALVGSWIFAAVVLFALISLAVVLFSALAKRRVKSSPAMDIDLVDKIIASLGGHDNCVRAFQEGGRTKITVSDTIPCNFQRLKELGATQVFISGNTVKMMCPFNTEKLVDTINQR